MGYGNLKRYRNSWQSTVTTVLLLEGVRQLLIRVHKHALRLGVVLEGRDSVLATEAGLTVAAEWHEWGCKWDKVRAIEKLNRVRARLLISGITPLLMSPYCTEQTIYPEIFHPWKLRNQSTVDILCFNISIKTVTGCSNNQSEQVPLKNSPIHYVILILIDTVAPFHYHQLSFSTQQIDSQTSLYVFT